MEKGGIMEEGFKACAFCAEPIREAAVVCRFCNRNLTEAAVATQNAKPISYNLRYVAGFVLFILVVGGMVKLATGRPQSSEDPAVRRWNEQLPQANENGGGQPNSPAADQETDYSSAFATCSDTLRQTQAELAAAQAQLGEASQSVQSANAQANRYAQALSREQVKAQIQVKGARIQQRLSDAWKTLVK